MTVSTGASVLTGMAGLLAVWKALVWRRTKVKLKVSSSSFSRRIRKLGGAAGEVSGSYQAEVSVNPAFFRGGRSAAYLNVFHDAVVSEVPPRIVPGGGEGVRGDVQEEAAARVGDGDGGDGDCTKRSAWLQERVAQGPTHSDSGRAGTEGRPRPGDC